MRELLNTTVGRIIIGILLLLLLYKLGIFDSLLIPDCSKNPGDLMKSCNK